MSDTIQQAKDIIKKDVKDTLEGKKDDLDKKDDKDDGGDAEKLAAEKAAAEVAEKEKVAAEKEAAEKEAKEKEAKEAKEDGGLAALEDQNKALLDQVEALAGQVFEGAAGTVAKVKDGELGDKIDKDKKDKKSDKETEPVEFVSQEEFEDALSSAKNLNTLLTKVATTAADEGQRRGYEQAIRETPALVDKLTGDTLSLREAVRDFLDVNKDLIPVRKFVGVITNELKAENPDWPLNKLFDEAGKVVRERLKLSKVAKDINDQEGVEGKPGFTPRGGGGGGSARNKDTKSKLSPLQEEISELAEFAEGK